MGPLGPFFFASDPFGREFLGTGRAARYVFRKRLSGTLLQVSLIIS